MTAAPPAARREGREVLAAGLQALSLSLGEDAQERLLQFLDLLERWNRAYNLTRIVGLEAMVRLHVLDSLTARPELRGEHVLDLGTGAGLPGLPLAIASPERRFVLLDAAAKKVRFCEHVAMTLGLPNVAPVHGRAEHLQPERPFDTVVSRAVGSIGRVVGWSRHLIAPNGRWILMKGARPERELEALVEELGPIGENAEVRRVHVPGDSVERHLVVIEAAAANRA